MAWVLIYRVFIDGEEGCCLSGQRDPRRRRKETGIET